VRRRTSFSTRCSLQHAHIHERFTDVSITVLMNFFREGFDGQVEISTPNWARNSAPHGCSGAWQNGEILRRPRARGICASVKGYAARVATGSKRKQQTQLSPADQRLPGAPGPLPRSRQSAQRFPKRRPYAGKRMSGRSLCRYLGERRCLEIAPLPSLLENSG
jgi:hypothetical protein